MPCVRCSSAIVVAAMSDDFVIDISSFVGQTTERVDLAGRKVAVEC